MVGRATKPIVVLSTNSKVLELISRVVGASLLTCHPVLLGLAAIRSALLLGLLLFLVHVAHGVRVLVVLFLLLELGTLRVTLGPVVTGSDEHTVVHSPDFLAGTLGELLGVRNDTNTTLERLNRLD